MYLRTCPCACLRWPVRSCLCPAPTPVCVYLYPPARQAACGPPASQGERGGEFKIGQWSKCSVTHLHTADGSCIIVASANAKGDNHEGYKIIAGE